MKSILLSACILALASSVTIAQSNTKTVQLSTTQATVSTKAQFSSGINDLDAQLQANNIEKAQSAYNNLQTAMRESLADTKLKMSQVDETKRSSLMEIYREKQTLYVEIHNLSKDLSANHAVLQTKLTAFSKIAD